MKLCYYIYHIVQTQKNFIWREYGGGNTDIVGPTPKALENHDVGACAAAL